MTGSLRAPLRPLNGARPTSVSIDRPVDLHLPDDECIPGSLLRHDPPSKRSNLGPEVLPHKIPFPFRISPRDMDRTLSFDVSDHLGDRILRGNRYHHMHVIWHQMTFLDSALLLPAQTSQNFSQLTADLAKYRFLTVFRYGNYVVLTLPTAVI